MAVLAGGRAIEVEQEFPARRAGGEGCAVREPGEEAAGFRIAAGVNVGGAADEILVVRREADVCAGTHGRGGLRDAGGQRQEQGPKQAESLVRGHECIRFTALPVVLALSERNHR